MPDTDPEKQEVSRLLNNIQKGINAIGISRLNTALCTILLQEDGKDKAITLVIATVCDDFNVAPATIKNKYASAEAMRAREMCFCILHYEFNIPTRAISRAVMGNENHTTVFQIIKRYRTINENIKDDREFKNRYDKIFSKIKPKLTNT
jgi:chromosomal replication initiation ATPase DnaA